MVNGTIAPMYWHGGVDLCRADFQGSAALCAKMVIFGMASFITAVACAWKAFRIYRGVTMEKYHLIALLLAMAEGLILGLHWMYLGRTELHFTALYLLVNEFLVMCVFYGGLAVKIFHNKKYLERLYYPIAVVIFLYFTAVLAYSFNDVANNSTECTHPQWLLFSASQFVLAQLILISGFLLTKAMNSVTHIDPKYLHSKKIVLWSLIIVFELSSIYNFSFDLALKFDTKNNHCDSLFGSPDSAEYILVTWLQWLVGYLLPVWVMLIVLKPAINAATIQRNTMARVAGDFEMDGTTDDEMSVGPPPHSLHERLLAQPSSELH